MLDPYADDDQPLVRVCVLPIKVSILVQDAIAVNAAHSIEQSS